MLTCNRLDLQTLGFQPVMLKIIPDHWVTIHSFDHFHDRFSLVEPCPKHHGLDS